MMKRIIFRIYLLAALCLSVGFAEVHASAPDSLRVRWISGRKYTIHKVNPKETWTSISRRYNTGIDDLMKANPGVKLLKAGQIINVPASPSLPATPGNPENSGGADASSAKVEADMSAKENRVKVKESVRVHLVKAGENLFRIASLYGITVEELKVFNGLTANKVIIGQKLKIPTPTPVKASPETSHSSSETPAIDKDPKIPASGEESPHKAINRVPVPDRSAESSKPSDTRGEVRSVDKAPDTIAYAKSQHDNGEELPKVYSNPGTTRTSVIEKDPKSGIEIEKVTEVGVATWIEDGALNQNKFYALHRTVQAGTIIKITNRMNNNSVFVKVIGVLPETGDHENVIIKVTQAAAQRIGALDKKFTAELSYGISR